MNKSVWFLTAIVSILLSARAETHDSAGEQIDVAYIDNARLFFAWPPENVNHAIPLAVLSLDETGLMDRYFLTGAMAPVYCGSSFPPFSLYWFVKDKVPYSIMGDGAISSSFHVFLFFFVPVS